MIRRKTLAVLLVVNPFLATSVLAANLTFFNDTAANVHLDWTSCDWVDGSKPDEGKNFANHAKVTYSCGTNKDLLFAQYSAGSVVKETPKCYIHFDNSGEPQLSSDSTCVLDKKTRQATLKWKTPDINFTKLAKDINTVVNTFIGQKPSLATGLMPNVMPLVTPITNYEDWQKAFSYDASRYPLWNGAYCIANPADGLCPKQLLSNFMKAIKTASPEGRINTAGYWAYTKGNSQDGIAVPGGSFDVKPALMGPIAAAELAVNGEGVYYLKLVEQLNSYDLSSHTPITAAGQGYPNSSDPYFNGSLNLLTQALLASKGTFNLDNKDIRVGYVSYTGFMENYKKWNRPEFLAPVVVTDNQNKKYDALRVIFSVDTAPHIMADDWDRAGGAPTVSEGMAYGLLIAYAANDQTAFDKLLNYVLYISNKYGCAGMNEKQTDCSIKTNYLMPWMIDETGRPFHYTIAGGYLTNGSASDADLNFVWALGLASSRWKTPSNSLMVQQTYEQIAQEMIKEMAFFDFNQDVSYGNAKYTLISPGSQWGAAGKAVFYPGYDAPEAFKMMETIKAKQ